MSAIKTLNDSNWKQEIDDKPALILMSNGSGLRGDFVSAFKKAATEKQSIVFAEINPDDNPQTAELFNVNSKPVMVGWYNDEIVVRKTRPWGSDVVLTLELLEQQYTENHKPKSTDEPQNEEPTMTDEKSFDTKPVAVTDATFEDEVINYSNDMPVLVDFWAEWCGPCRMVAPIMEKLAEEFSGKIRVAKVDTDANPGLSQAFRIMSIPTIMAFKDGVLVFSQPGAFPEAAFRDLINQVIDLDVQAAMAEQEKQQQ